MVFENQFYTLLLCLHRLDIKYRNILESNLKKNKSVLTHITFYHEDDDYRSVYFNNETISFNCVVIRI